MPTGSTGQSARTDRTGSAPRSAGRVVCLGLAVLDVVQRVDEPPTWGRKHVSRSAEVVAGGPATNAAVCAAALLGSATLVTGLGGSVAAAAVREELSGYGVRVLDLAPRDWQLPVAACLVDAAGERTVVSPGALTTTWGLTPAAEAAVAQADVLLLDGHHPKAASAALAAVSAGPGGCHRLLDAGSAKPHAEAWLSDLDIVAGSADYAAGLGLSLRDALAHLLDAGAGAAVVTDGAGDVLWAERAGPRWGPREATEVAGTAVHRLRPPSVRAVDTLGAGDAFHGALAAAIACGYPLADAVAVAAAVASTRVAHVGARAWLAALTPLSRP